MSNRTWSNPRGPKYFRPRSAGTNRPNSIRFPSRAWRRRRTCERRPDRKRCSKCGSENKRTGIPIPSANRRRNRFRTDPTKSRPIPALSPKPNSKRRPSGDRHKRRFWKPRRKLRPSERNSRRRNTRTFRLRGSMTRSEAILRQVRHRSGDRSPRSKPYRSEERIRRNRQSGRRRHTRGSQHRNSTGGFPDKRLWRIL